MKTVDFALEASSGVLLPLFAIMVAFAGLRLVNLWRQTRKHQRSWRWSFRYFYLSYRPSIAIFILSVALLSRFVDIWYELHLTNYDPKSLGTKATLTLVSASTLLLLFAVSCWVRSISPFTIRNWQWIIILGLCVIFGMAIAL